MKQGGGNLPVQAPVNFLDQSLLKAIAHPIRVHILSILSEGPSSPSKMQKRMRHVSLNLVSHHVKVLRDLGCIEFIGVVKKRGAKEHLYRSRERQFFDTEEWEQVNPEQRQPITAVILRMISEDTGRSLAEGKFDEKPDNHLSRSPVELDQEGWSEVVGILANALDEVLEAHARSAERARVSGEELTVARVAIMQYPIGREGASDGDAQAT